MGNNQDAKVTPSLLPDERYRLLYEASRDIIWLIRLDGSIAEVNQAAVSSYGYSREELLKMNLRELRHASQQALLEDHLAQAQEGGIRFETVHVRKDGSSFPVEVNASSVRLGEETFILGVVRDISERKASEVKLRALQQTTQAQLDELKTLLELLPVGVWTGNEDCSTIVGNPAAYAMLGLAPGINASLTSAKPELPEGLRLFVNGVETRGDDLPMQQVARTGRPLKNFEHEILYPDGTVKTILANIAPVFDDTGKVRKVIGAYTDYSERKRTERQRAFLDDLALELSHTAKAEDIMQRVGEKIGSYLNVPYCHFMAIDEAKDEVIYLARWNRAGVMRLPDKVKLSEQISEDFRKLAHAGETVVSNDTSKNPITKGEANAAINAAAFITVPFLKGGEWT